MEDILAQTVHILKSNDVSGHWNKGEVRYRIRSVVKSKAKRVASPDELAIKILKLRKEPDNLFILSEYFGFSLISILEAVEEVERARIRQEHKKALSSLMERHKKSDRLASTWFSLQNVGQPADEFFAHVLRIFAQIASLATSLGSKDQSNEFAATAIGLDDLDFYKSLLEGPKKPIPDIALRAGLRWAPYTALKHLINTQIVMAFREVFAPSLLKVLETCQGLGDATCSYLKLSDTMSVVLSTEKNISNRAHAAMKVPHIEYPCEFDPSSFPLGRQFLGSSFDTFTKEMFGNWGNDFLCIMPSGAQKCHMFMRKFDELSPNWSFNVLDVDAYGFPESSDLDVSNLTRYLDDLAVVALSNGLISDRFQVPDLSMLKMFCTYAGGSVRRELPNYQRKVIFQELPFFEMAFRIRAFKEKGFNLVPVLLYDYRTRQGGLIRTYYLMFRKTTSLLESSVRKMVTERLGLPYTEPDCFFNIETGKKLKLPFDKIPNLVPGQIFSRDPSHEELHDLSKEVGSLVKQRMNHIRGKTNWR